MDYETACSYVLAALDDNLREMKFRGRETDPFSTTYYSGMKKIANIIVSDHYQLQKYVAYDEALAKHVIAEGQEPYLHTQFD